MDNKKLGIALIIASLIIVAIFFYIKSETGRLVDIQIQTTNRNGFSMFRDQCAEY